MDVNSDRLVVEARRAGFLLDVFLPYTLDEERAGAVFHRDRQQLIITIAVTQ